jgi:hypothetical protein
MAFALLSGGDCQIGDLGDILDEPGKIVVTNGGLEPGVLSITAGDVKSYPTLNGGAAASVTTNVGGQYQVTVIMTPESAIEYRAELTELRSSVEKLISGSSSAAEKTRAYVALAGIKEAIQGFEQGSGASCSGRIKLDADDPATVNATVTWVTQSGSGFWDLTCGSND